MQLVLKVRIIHEGITYACDQCDYLATQQGHLKEHIQAKHEGVMFGCSKCNKQFSFRSGLNRHYRIVHDEGVRVEPMTPNNAANRGVGRTEVVSGDAKFECQDCDRVYSSPGALWNHTKSIHEGVNL